MLRLRDGQAVMEEDLAMNDTDIGVPVLERLESEVGAMRMLVAIASYGEKNLHFLKQIIAEYRSMALQVDIVVLTNAAKNLGSGVDVRVGLPTMNPWSLPFAHKPIFLAAADRYDLFLYSEDDILITPSGPENLSAHCPRTVEEVERTMAQASVITGG